MREETQRRFTKLYRKEKRKSPTYYLAGPAAMVAAMRKTLNEAGVDDDNIRTEEFSGY
jgi:ferredoxin-NADP reductase